MFETRIKIRSRLYPSSMKASRERRRIVSRRALNDSKRKCGEGARSFDERSLSCTACFALKRTASVILPVLHNTMLADNLYTIICTVTREHPTSNVHVILYIYIYIIDYSNTFIIHFAPFRSSSNLSIQQQSFSIYIYISFFNPNL